ncbi:MAG: tetratricopeptide repeat protein [Pirellulales bacterium]
MAKRPVKHRPPAIAPATFWLASLLFFASGGTGLIYQVIWFKRFSHVWGSSGLAFAAVGGSFLLGLGLGAYLLGQRADRLASPLRWYGVCELAIGLAALLIPLEIGALVDASAGLYARIPEQPAARFLVQLVITFLVIGPPCALMGGTLPLLVRELTARSGSLDQATGWLYAINTFGAAAGCYLAGFHLLPSFGLAPTNYATAATNIAIGILAVAASRSARPAGNAPGKAPHAAAQNVPATNVATPRATGGARWQARLLYLAAALTGCGALVLEMTWSRQLALVLGGSTYSYSATLFVVLVGIALGSLLFHGALRPVASSPLVPAAIVAVLAVATLAGKWSLPWLSLAVAPEGVRALRGEQFTNGLICAGVSAVLELIPAVAMGALFPLLVHLTRAGAAHVGAAVGNVYAWNTLGSLAGATLTSVLLFPHIGTAGAMALAVSLYGLALLAMVPWPMRSARTAGAVATLAAAGAAVLIALPTDPRLTNLGFYLHGDPRLRPERAPLTSWDEVAKTLFFREGASCNVYVGTAGDGSINLRVNGKVDASSNVDMETQLGMAYLPRVFRPDAKDVLVIGFGSGCTPGASLLFPGTRVTCCEIEPAVYEAAPCFAAFNHEPYKLSRRWLAEQNALLPAAEQRTSAALHEAARFSIVLGDGRTALQGSDKKYDIVLSEPSNPWVAGVSNLFTSEYFRTVREHLNEGGLLVAWIQTYDFSIGDYAMIVRTLREQFPYYGALLLVEGVDTLLVASDRPLVASAEHLARLQQVVDATPAIATDLKQRFGSTDMRWLLLRHYQLGQQQLDRMVDADGSQAVNTDAHLRLEFDAPLHVFARLPARESAQQVLKTYVEAGWSQRVAAGMGVDYHSAECQLRLGELLLAQLAMSGNLTLANRRSRVDRAAGHFAAALAAAPDSTAAKYGLAQARVLQNRRTEGMQMLAELVRAQPDDPGIQGDLATEYFAQKRLSEAAAHYREALRLDPELTRHPRSAAWANNLAWILATSTDDRLRNGAEAVRWARQVCQHDQHRQPTLLDTLAAALAEDGQFDEAVRVSRQVLELAAGQADLAETTRQRIRLYEKSQPYREP